MKTRSNSRGKRYTDAERRKILNHVEHINKTRGRGGIASASRKFGVTPLTISNWLNADEPLALTVRSSSKRDSSKSNRTATLRKLATLREEIGKRQRLLAKLHREFEALKRQI